MKAKNVIGKLFEFPLDSMVQISFRDEKGALIHMCVDEIKTYTRVRYDDPEDEDEKVVVFHSNEIIGNFHLEVHEYKGMTLKVFKGGQNDTSK